MNVNVMASQRLAPTQRCTVVFSGEYTGPYPGHRGEHPSLRIVPNTASERRLRRHGVSTQALAKSRIYLVRWLPGSAITVPLPFLGVAILIRRDLLNRDTDEELADGPELAPLVHQLCHAHQRLEWGFALYLWRHLRAGIRQRTVPSRISQVERECYQAERATVEYYREEQLSNPGQDSSWRLP